MDKELVLAGPPSRRFRLRVSDATIEQTTFSVKGVAKTTTKQLATTEDARREADKLLRAKLRAGYAYIAPDAARGAILHESFGPGGGGGAVLDLSLDGTQLATASITSESAFGAKVHVIDVDTGARRVVFEEPGGHRQSFLHAVLFDRAGERLYIVLNNDTFLLELATGKRHPIANCSPLNPHVVHPSFDGERRRLVVFADGGSVRVLDAANASPVSLLDVPGVTATAECRAAAISPSGRLLAVYIPSRALIYNHDDARRDSTNEVRIWDIDAGTLRATVPMRQQISAVSVLPDDATLLVSPYYAQGPIAIDIATGKERWRFAAAATTGPFADRLPTAYCWAPSPDGTQIAIGREVPHLYTLATREPIELQDLRGYRAQRIVFSGDGTRLAASVDGTNVVYRL